LPTPVSPWSSTLMLACAMRSTRRHRVCITVSGEVTATAGV
jgi:hypothetical protein